jgi:hypothetical protein
VTSNGDLLACALKIAPIALPVDVGDLPGGLRVAVRHPDHDRLLEAEDVAKVAREVGQHRQLRGAGVAEQRRHPLPAKKLERRIANGRHGRTLLQREPHDCG